MRAYHGANHPWAWRRHLPDSVLRFQDQLPADPRLLSAVTLDCTRQEWATIETTATWDIDYCRRHQGKPMSQEARARLGRISEAATPKAGHQTGQNEGNSRSP